MTAQSEALTTKACLVSALDALDQQTGEGRVEDPEPFEILQAEAFDLLRQSGEMFARFDGSFASLVHQGGGWPNQPVECDGVTLYHNTFKSKEQLNPAQRAQEYQNRVDTFLGGGASIDDIVLLTPDSLQSLKAWAHYDYVMLPNYETRVYPTTPEDLDGKPKAGHSLLIGVGADFEDRDVLSAGELWLLKDSAGDLEAVIIANNSGHFKPSFNTLPNTIPGICCLGVPKDRIVLFGGPNNIAAIFREFNELHGITELEKRLPVAPTSLLASWWAAETS